MIGFKKVALAAGLLLSAEAATAEVHDVLILRYGYFPAEINLNPGDEIRFINKSPNWVRVFSKEHSDNLPDYRYNEPCRTEEDTTYLGYQGDQDGWFTNWIPKGGEVKITINECSEKVMRAPSVYNYNYYEGYNNGTISFEPADNGF